MTLETLIAPTEGLLGSAPTGLKLRLTGRTGQSRVVGISGSKCTIGKSPECTLRIEDSAAEPVQCLILRGAARTVVRRLSNATTLNGREFADAVLRPGDTLRSGACSIEILPADADLGQEPSK